MKSFDYTGLPKSDFFIFCFLYFFFSHCLINHISFDIFHEFGFDNPLNLVRKHLIYWIDNEQHFLSAMDNLNDDPKMTVWDCSTKATSKWVMFLSKLSVSRGPLRALRDSWVPWKHILTPLRPFTLSSDKLKFFGILIQGYVFLCACIETSKRSICLNLQTKMRDILHHSSLLLKILCFLG